jgi:integrase
MTPKPRTSNRYPAHIIKDKDKLPNGVWYHSFRKKGHWRVNYCDPSTGKQKSKRICDGSASMHEIWHAFEFSKKTDEVTFRNLSLDFQKSFKWRELSQLTQQDYQFCHEKICETKTKTGLLGDEPIVNWTTGTIRKYRDKRGEQSISRSNKEMAYIKRIFSWAIEYEKIKNNISLGVTKLKNPPRQHYASDDDYKFLMEVAEESGYWYLPYIIELAYECRMRSIEVLEMSDANETSEGLIINRAKGSKDNITLWSDNLLSVWNRAKSTRNQILEEKNLVRQINPEFRWLFISDRTGDKITSRGLKSAKSRVSALAKAKAEKLGINFTDFTLHDVKRKSISDTVGDKMAASGHRSQSMMNVYDVSKQKVKPTRDK